MGKIVDKKRKRRRAVMVAALGAALAILCRMLPEEYQAPCATVVKLCIGGL